MDRTTLKLGGLYEVRDHGPCVLVRVISDVAWNRAVLRHPGYAEPVTFEAPLCDILWPAAPERIEIYGADRRLAPELKAKYHEWAQRCYDGHTALE